ncbi:hypothetical protein FIBSPDRAFT_966980 [Athelia psychrophila]|uniref:Uncharacterized protein n=1 Tax=Athelia psychrophila TaxID=1759441 RepID=A0A167W810_9AGAM|nr:hypothetical protein FIBSPDRAFT_966980 [Fibularhizoctonia sp. CBS 109695]
MVVESRKRWLAAAYELAASPLPERATTQSVNGTELERPVDPGRQVGDRTGTGVRAGVGEAPTKVEEERPRACALAAVADTAARTVVACAAREEPGEGNESGDEDGEVADMLDDSPAKMAIEMNTRMQVGPSLLQNEWGVVEEDGKADMNFEYYAPTPHGLSKFSKRPGMGSSGLGWGRRRACRLRILCASVLVWSNRTACFNG